LLPRQIRSKMIKYILLIGCLWAACGNHALAQQTASTPVVSVTKPAFSGKVADFNTRLAQGEKAGAEVLFNDLNRMANAEVAASRDKMRTATAETDKAKYRDLTMNQRRLFAEALKLKQHDMMANQKAIVEKLEQFAATIQ